MSDPVVETNRLTRYFGQRAAVRDLTMAIPRGSVFGFLGRNGSGKSTTLRILLGLLEPTRGSAKLLGHDCTALPPGVRGRIGYMAEGHPVYGWMRVDECGEFQSRFFPTWNERIFRSVTGHFGLRGGAHAKDLSRGERAGLCLALTLAPEPELLVLDEPALGLDPIARRSLLESMIYVTRNQERTILFSSHLLSDVERVADHIAILDDGVLRAQCSLSVFQQRVKRYLLRYDRQPPVLPEIPGLLRALRTDSELRLTVVNMNGDANGVLGNLGAASIEELPISLEEAFIDYLDDREEKSFFLSDIKDTP